MRWRLRWAAMVAAARGARAGSVGAAVGGTVAVGGEMKGSPAVMRETPLGVVITKGLSGMGIGPDGKLDRGRLRQHFGLVNRFVSDGEEQ
jgi:hypothetical protein